MEFFGGFVFVTLLAVFNADAKTIGLQNNEVTGEISNSTVTCKELQGDICRLECQVKLNARDALIAELERRFLTCGKPMELTLKGTPFPTGSTFRKADLNGEFELKTLKIDQCDRFSRIEDNAFDKPSLNNLETLIIKQSEGNGIEVMNNQTFDGLKKLKNFDFKNTVARKKLTGEGILKPLAATLEYVKFEQTAVREGSDYNYEPGLWFKGGNYTKLTEVDLRNNYFPGLLKENTFEGLEHVKRLHLAGNDIGEIANRTLQPMNGTLEYLDLSDNLLVTLSDTILMGLSEKFVQLKLIGNRWDCSCENEEFLGFCHGGKLNYIEEPICKTPKKRENRIASKVLDELCCEEPCDETTTSATESGATTIETTLSGEVD